MLFLNTHQLAKLLILGAMCSLPISYVYAGNTSGGSITVPLTSCLTGLESAA